MMEIPNGLFDRFLSLFSSEEGEKCYRRALDAVRENAMEKRLSEGTLVGFSGGADSAFLLGFLAVLRSRSEVVNETLLSDFRLAACHVHHGIRGEEADADLAFSEAFAKALGVEFLSRSIDVPAVAAEKKIGMEEAAREVRYSAFEEIIRGRNDLSTVALAHNATDVVETFLFRLLRGAGTDGLSGIPAVRGNIVRPLLGISSSEIRSLLDAHAIPYAVDSTNSDLSYRRNLIRQQILPTLRLLNPDPETAVARAVKNLSEDRAFLSSLADAFLSEHPAPCSAEALAGLSPAVFYRVFAKMCAPFGFLPEECHVDAARKGLAKGTDFSISLPLGYVFTVRNGKAFVARPSDPKENNEKEEEPIIFRASFGQNNGIEYEKIDRYGVAIAVAVGNDAPAFPKIWQNVYKIVIQADLSSAIIEGGLSMRFRREGDAYRYKGITHKLKKMMNDKEIPQNLRGSVPVFTDGRGILWVPGFGVRDDGARSERRIAVYRRNDLPTSSELTPSSLHIPYRGVFFTEEPSE